MNRPFSILARTALVCATFAVMLLSSSAEAQIKRPGAHPKYSVELEPQLILQYADEEGLDEHFGLGAAVSIPIIDNGPISTINNSMGLRLGLNWTHANDPCWGQGRFRGGRWNGFVGDDCTSNQIWVPLAWQWNFFLTPMISVMGEIGPAIQHVSVELDCGGAGCPVGATADYSDTDVELYVSGGVRFHLADQFALTLRLGHPFISAGASFFL